MCSSTQDNDQTRPGFTAVGVHDTALPVTATVIARPTPTALGNTATMVLLQPETQGIRYTLDGSTPVAALHGFFVAAGTGVVIPLPPTSTLTIIEEAVAALVQVQWGR